MPPHHPQRLVLQRKATSGSFVCFIIHKTLPKPPLSALLFKMDVCLMRERQGPVLAQTEYCWCKHDREINKIIKEKNKDGEVVVVAAGLTPGGSGRVTPWPHFFVLSFFLFLILFVLKYLFFFFFSLSKIKFSHTTWTPGLKKRAQKACFPFLSTKRKVRGCFAQT